MKPCWVAMLVSLIFLGTPVFSGEAELFESPVSLDRMPELEGVLADLSRYPVQKGSFVQEKEIKRLGRSFRSSGDFIFTENEGILWRVHEPFPSETLLLEDRMVQRTQEGGSTVLDGGNNPVFLNFAAAFLAVFAGDLEELASHFELFYRREGQGHLIGLVPLDKTISAIVESITITIVGQGLEGMKMVDSHGDSITYEFEISHQGDALKNSEQSLFSP